MLDWKLWRWIVTAVLTVVSLTFLVPTMAPKDERGNPELPNWWKGNLPERSVNLGLDLQGGMHVDLAVDVKAAVQNRLERIGESIEMALQTRNAVIPTHRVVNGQLIFTATAETQSHIREIVSDQYPDFTSPRQSGETIGYEFTDAGRRNLEDMAVRQALDTIRNRIDQFGVREADTVRKGDDRIVVQIPGIRDPQRALDLIQSTAQLEFKLVETGVSQSAIQQWVRTAYQQEPTLQTAPSAPHNVQRLNELLADQLPAGTQILFGRLEGGSRQPYLLQTRSLMTGDAVSHAEVRINTQYGDPYVSLDFSREGAARFEQITGENVGRQLAIVLDGTVRSAPRINERIAGGQAQVTGAFTMDESRDLAIALRSGALPAPVNVVEKRIVGPTLGADSIRAGLSSIMIATVFILIFIVLYYNAAGLVANLALALNLLFIIGILAMFEATLTLPGIAGIILTIGMAVDANIIIFERMREEQRLGKSARSALEAGYGKAIWTIVDAQVTGLVAAVVLFQFGTGPVKGFAVTLTIGLLTSIFTAVFVTKMIFDVWLGRRSGRKINLGIKIDKPVKAPAGK
jgi:protein-export membrane protein SecD